MINQFFTLICINKARLKIHIIDGKVLNDSCDGKILGINDYCDLYVTVKINGVKVYTTKTIDGQQHAQFNEKFTTADKFTADSTVFIQMYDKDPTIDDPMAQWTLEPKDFGAVKKLEYPIAWLNIEFKWL